MSSWLSGLVCNLYIDMCYHQMQTPPAHWWDMGCPSAIYNIEYWSLSYFILLLIFYNTLPNVWLPPLSGLFILNHTFFLPIHGHNHPRCTEATLCSIVISKSFLDDMKSSLTAAQTLSGGHLHTIASVNWSQTLTTDHSPISLTNEVSATFFIFWNIALIHVHSYN